MEIHLAYKEPKEMVAVSTWNGWLVNKNQGVFITAYILHVESA
jgi:hypothetical protein